MLTTLRSGSSVGDNCEKNDVHLLVSVRDFGEAKIAMATGIDWLDVKDPSRGALGRPDLELALSIERLAYQKSPGLRVSVALGESMDTTGKELREYASRFQSATSFKLAFSGTNPSKGTYETGKPSPDESYELFLELAASLPRGMLIPVFYADWQEANAPGWDKVLELASKSSCNRILIDTFCKNGRSLLDYLNRDQLRGFVNLASSMGILVALAGSIRKQAIEELKTVGADVIGVRGAACRGGNRTDSIDQATLQELIAILKS